VFTVALSYFPELDIKLDLLGSGYNADLLSDEMELSGPEPVLPHRPPTILPMAPERSSAL
jgi:hypothetical protein